MKKNDVKRTELNVKDYVEGIIAQDLAVLSRGITLIESKNPAHQEMAKKVLHQLIDKTGHAKRIGISGSPGVGKSTFIESFGSFLTGLGHKVAVLAIDPSSQLTGGSILGDKTRMSRLSNDKNAFVRPSPSGDHLGGVASKTREAMLLCEAAGYDIILIETVGVGQSEITVSKIVDFFLLLMQPGGGDDLQGIKRGILELSDLVAVNKADGDLLNQAKLAKAEYESAVHILRNESSWTPKVITCSGHKGTGLDDIWENIKAFYQMMEKEGQLDNKRSYQVEQWIWELLFEKVKSNLKTDDKLNKLVKSKFELVKSNKNSVLDTVDELYQSLRMLK